jgi:tryptophanyl-tRNA synthetase
MKQRVFSGTRATGRLHLGNYFGAIKGYIDLQNRPELECLYMVVDLHSITTPFTPTTLRSYTKEVVLDYLGAGLDPAKATITLQSLVPEHTYLSWLFSSVVSIARLQHLPTFKEKVKLHPDDVTLSLLSYPVLMAADILIYQAELVPVGIDQEPHIEMAREIARKINQRFSTTLREPQRFATPVNSVPSLTGEGKMSKSVEGSTIFLTDTLSEISKKIAQIPTNSGKGSMKKTSGKNPKQQYTDERGVVSPGLTPLFEFVEMFQGGELRAKYESAYQKNGVRFGEIKSSLSTAIHQELQPIQERRAAFADQGKLVDDILNEGATTARRLAGETLAQVQEAFGFYRPRSE